MNFNGLFSLCFFSSMLYNVVRGMAFIFWLARLSSVVASHSLGRNEHGVQTVKGADVRVGLDLSFLPGLLGYWIFISASVAQWFI